MNKIDSHCHIIDPRRFPVVPGVGYTPRSECEWGTFEAFEDVLARNRVTHALLVQPSCYGTDNSAMLDAISSSGGRFKGIAVVDAAAADEELAKLAACGVVGLRFNMVHYDAGILDDPAVGALLERIGTLGWYLQVHALSAQWPALIPTLMASGVRVILDHFGMPGGTLDAEGAGLTALLRAARLRDDWAVKLTAPYRFLPDYPCVSGARPIVARIVDAFGIENCIWGSDWPHLNTAHRVTYQKQIEHLCEWFPDSGDRQRILWDNPARMFGFL